MGDPVLRLLAIDDDPADLRLLERSLANVPSWNVELRGFRDSIPALVEVMNDPPDALILDYRIGAQNGLEVFRSAREAGYAGPVIFLTGRGDEEAAVQAMQAGASDYLRKKHLTPESLQRSVTNSLEKHALRLALDKHRVDLARANTDLTKRNQEIRSFYQVLSHELKTPLTVMREFVTMVIDGLGGETTGEQREFLGIALESCDQMTRHINDLFDVTRLETGKLALDRQPQDLGRFTRQLVTSLRPLAESEGVALRIEAGEDDVWVEADHVRITQVLSNLVRNAVKYTPSGGTVTVRVDRPDRGTARVSVSDTGVGIPGGDESRVFDRLFQTKNTGPEHGGIGLGLHLSRELVRLHGGEMTVESTPGAGSTFSFTLPEVALATQGSHPRFSGEDVS